MEPDETIPETQPHGSGFMRSLVVLVATTAMVAALLVPFAWHQSGSAGIEGVAISAAICLGTGCIAEALACVSANATSPLMGLLLGMGFRMLPPLALCLFLALQGAHGRDHLAFIGYLLLFYLSMLGAETWLALRRVTEQRPLSGS